MAFGSKPQSSAIAKEEEGPALGLDDLFIPATELETIPRLTLAIFGRAKVGKSHFGLTVAEALEGPVYIIDTEGSIKLNLIHFDSKIRDHVYVAEVLQFAGLANNKVNLVQSLDKLKKAILAVTEKAIAEGPDVKGTFIVDSATDIWDWLQTWLEEAANVKRTKSGDMPRFEWGKANEQYAIIMYMMLRTRWNVILTFRAKPAVDNQGVDFGYNIPRWQKNTDHWVDLIAELKIDESGNRVMKFTGGRYGENLPTLEDPSYSRLIEHLTKETGVTFE